MNGKILFCAQKKIHSRFRGILQDKNSSHVHRTKHVRDWAALCHARGSRGRVVHFVPKRPVLGMEGPTRHRGETQAPSAQAPEVFQPRGGGVFRESPVLGNMEILLLALCKNGGGSLWIGSKRQFDLYLSNDQTRRHPQRKFRNSRVKTNCI